MKIRVFEAFAGYGSQAMALKRLHRDFPGNVDFDFVGISEIDKYAIAAYNALHGATQNLGDISKIDWTQAPDFDLFTYSFPCQDISTAGKQRGFAEGSGSRSSLLWECRRAIEAKHPRFLLMENVKALVQKKFMPEFQRWINTLAELGYTSFWQILNAKDFGVPQNRERVFMVSILGEAAFEFPKPFPLEKRLRDVLENSVDESYFLKDEQMQRILAHCERKQAERCGFKTQFLNPDCVCGTIMGLCGRRETDPYIKIGKINDAPEIQIIGNYKPSGHACGRVVSISGISPTVMENHGAITAIAIPFKFNYRVRKLTPTECFRLMGVDDADIQKLSETAITTTLKSGRVKNSQIPKSQLYKMAGNSIVVDVIYSLFYQLLIAKPSHIQSKQLTLDL